MLATINVLAAEQIDRSHSWIWPEGYEIWFGSAASIIVFLLLWWKAWPFVKKAMKDRTARIQDQLDTAAAERAAAESEAATIRAAKGDIGTEREQMLTAADEQVVNVLAEGRRRLEREVADLHARAAADIASSMGRSHDELRAEISRLAAAAADQVVVESLDDETQQRLIETFIERVGQSR